eukprot:4366244-Amphidinium_carterae.2
MPDPAKNGWANADKRNDPELLLCKLVVAKIVFVDTISFDVPTNSLHIADVAQETKHELPQTKIFE